jgi:Flp pilus assembly CpaE family ATPase
MFLSDDAHDFSPPAGLEFSAEADGVNAGDSFYTRSPSAGAPDTMDLSIALILPNDRYREAFSACLAEYRCRQVRAYTSYPPNLDDIPQLLSRQYDVVIIDLDSEMEVALSLVECISAQGSAMVMVCSANPASQTMVRCMRAGAREFLNFPLNKQVLVEAMERVAVYRPAQGADRDLLGKSMIFMGTKGGAGVTTVACNFAVALAQQSSRRTLLIDLDLQMGDAALNLGIQSAYSTVNALQAADRLDSTFLATLLVKHSTGLWVLPAPGKYVSFQPPIQAIERLVDVARQDFDCVVIDLGSRLNLSETSILQEAYTIYLVTQLGIADLRNSSRLISHYFSSGKARVEVVVNRYEPGGPGLDDKQIIKVLGRPLSWKIPSDYNVVRKMQVSGSPLVLTHSPIARMIRKMAEAVTAELDGPAEPGAEAKKPAFNLKSALGLSSWRRAASSKSEGESLSIVPPPQRSNEAEMGRPFVAEFSSAPAQGSADTFPERSGEAERSRFESARQAWEAQAETPPPAPLEPETRTYNGAVYIKGLDGQWHRRHLEAAEGEAEVASVTRAVPALQWPEPAPIHYGARLSPAQLNATASVPGTFSYVPGFGEVLDVGVHTLTASFTPQDSLSYIPAQVSISLKVSKAMPIIAWEAPEAILPGAKLSAVQLNARSEIAGRFVYNPPAGTVLTEGIHALSVIFIPDDSSKYDTALGVAPITVAPPMPMYTAPEPEPMPQPGPQVEPFERWQSSRTTSLSSIPVYAPEEEMAAALPPALSPALTPTAAEPAAKPITRPVLVTTKAASVPSWAEPAPIVYGTALSAEQFEVTASVPGEFVFNPRPGEVLAAGEHTLSARFEPEDEKKYAAAEVSVSLTVARMTPLLEWRNSAEIVYGTALNAELLSASASVPGTFEYLPAAGEVLSAGEHTLTARFTPEDERNYANAEVSLSLTVARMTPLLEWRNSAEIVYGTALSAELLNASASVPGTFEYLPAAGEVLSAGEHTLTARFIPEDERNYANAEVSVSLTVARMTPLLEWRNSAEIVYGTALNAELLSASASVPGTFEYLPAAGEVLSAGEHTLTARFTPEDERNYTTAEVSLSLTVARMTPLLEWRNSAEIVYGTALNAELLSASASVPGTFEYLPAAGEVLSAGEHTLTARFTPEDRSNYAPTEAVLAISVLKAEPEVSWPAPAPIVYGSPLGAEQLNPSSNVHGSFVYKPATGEVLGMGQHTLAAFFTPQDQSNYLAMEVSVPLTVAKAAPSLSWPDPEPIVYGAPLGKDQLRAAASLPGRFVYSPTAGEVLPAGSHTLTACFLPEDTENFAMAEISALLTVKKAVPVLSWADPAPIVYSTTLGRMQLNAQAEVAGNFEYNPAAGEVLPADTHLLSALFVPEDEANYFSTEATVCLTVRKASPAVTWSAPAPITYGTVLDETQLDARASIAGSFVYVPAAGEVLGAGTHTLEAIFTPQDSGNYTEAYASVTIHVSQATPSIIWADPQPISYGTALGPVQLNAVASTPGTFVYLPPAGALLAAGAHTPTVLFTPFDSANYTSAHAAVSLLVTKATPSIQWLDPVPLGSGNPLSAAQLNAKASVAGKFAFFPRAGTVLAPGTHKLQATFVPADAFNYNPTQVAVSLTITELKEAVIQWPVPAPIKYGTPLGPEQFNARASVPGTFVYSPSEGTILTAGMQTLQVTFVPDDDVEYAPVQASVPLVVEGGSQASQSPQRMRETVSTADAAAPAGSLWASGPRAPQEVSDSEQHGHDGSSHGKATHSRWRLLRR